jgi:hypothetical protein
MNPDFEKFIHDASEIADSGRWAAMNKRIATLAANPGKADDWHVQLFGSLVAQIFSEYLLVKQEFSAKRNGDASLLAWRARNLLELSIWCKSFATSKANARRIYEDAGRDAYDLFAAFETWGDNTAQADEWTQPFVDAKSALAERAAAEGIDPLDKSYTQVSNAAKECGLEAHFKLSFKFLSKFAHPTAMQILGYNDDAKTELQREMFFALACNFFHSAFAFLEVHQF